MSKIEVKLGAIYFDKLKNQICKVIDFCGENSKCAIVKSIHECYVTPIYCLKIATENQVDVYILTERALLESAN